MAKFNSIDRKNPDTFTHEGAPAYTRDSIEAWINMLFSSFLENQYYETSNEQISRFIELTNEVAEEYGYAFVAKAAIFVRNQLGMRSITQLTAAWLNDKTFQEKRNFYKAFMRRPDDVSEIFAAVDYLGGKRSHALIKGSADYLSSLGEYQIMKYKMIGHKYNMYDLINLTHAKSSVINAFKHDELEAPNTWEVNISTAKTDKDRMSQWQKMVEEGSLGYMALLRNLNNILNTNNPSINHNWIVKYLVPQLTDENKIRKSLVFPYRIYTAYSNLKVQNSAVIDALDKAFRIATANVPVFNGKNLIVLDVSGSMDSLVSNKSCVTLKEIGACFAATLIANGSDVDFIKFGTQAKAIDVSKLKLSSCFSIIDILKDNDRCGFSTELESVMDLIQHNDTNYDKIFLISDMQIFDSRMRWMRNPIDRWKSIINGAMTYSFDLANYRSQIEPPSNKFMFLTSLSDTFFKYIDIMDGKDDIVNLINSISF